jgi:cellulose synthase operon protein C
MIRNGSIVFAFSFLLTAARLTGQGVSIAQEHADKAAEFVQRGNLKDAEAELRKALQLSPEDPTLLTSLGGVLGMEGDLAGANPYLARAVKLKPQDALLRRNLAANQWQLGRLREAHENLEGLLRANPQDGVATFLMGVVCENEGDYPRSIQLLESIPVAHRQPEAVVALASSYYHTGRREEGQSTLKILRGRPVQARVMFLAGRVALEGRDYALAETLLSVVRSTYSDPAAVESQIALAQYRQGHTLKSEKTLAEAMQANHMNQEAYLLWCKMLADRGAYDRALQVAKDAAHAFPASYEVFSTKGSLEMHLLYYSDAVNSFEKASRLRASPEAMRELALAQWRVGNRKAAKSTFEDVMRQFPRDAEGYQEYGTLLLEDGSPESKAHAVELLKQAITVNDALVEARYQLANLDLAEGKPEDALPYLQGAIKLDPKDSRLHFVLSRALRRLGHDTDADKEMETFQKLKAAEQSAARNGSASGIPQQ